jgi:ParB family chromosome partitioning protein
MVSGGALTPGHARALLNERDADVLARWIVKRGLNVRQTERLIAKRERNFQRPMPGDPTRIRLGATLSEHAAGYTKDADTIALEHALADALGLKVTIDFDPRSGEGRIVVDYKTLEQLDEVIRRLRRSGAMPGTAAE